MKRRPDGANWRSEDPQAWTTDELRCWLNKVTFDPSNLWNLLIRALAKSRGQRFGIKGRAARASPDLHGHPAQIGKARVANIVGSRLSDLSTPFVE